MPRKNRLSREHWIDVALDALGREGLRGISVVPLAERLGVTKGSFYWHFRDLDDLVQAALGRWAVEKAGARIEVLEAIRDPRERLRRLMTPDDTEEVINRVDLALAASLDDPRVSPWLRRHNALWVAFAVRAFREMGFEAAECRNRAILAYTAYLGLVHLLAANPEMLAGESDVRSYVAFIRDQIVPAG